MASDSFTLRDAMVFDAGREYAVAVRVHRSQVDKAGEPYILHVLRVTTTVSDPLARVAAALHDVVEDSDLELADLAELGFPEAVLEAVDALTRRDGEDYFAFIERVARNPIAREVKIADLLDNLRLERIPEPTGRDAERAARYRAALERLTQGEH